MKKNILLLLPLVLFFCNTCVGTLKTYDLPNTASIERFDDSGRIEHDPHKLWPISSFLSLSHHNQLPIFPFNLFAAYLQPIAPLPYERYSVKFSLYNRNYRHNEGGDMLFGYIDEFRIVLPTGKTIDLLKSKATVTYTYTGSKKVTGIPYKILKNVKFQQKDGRNIIWFEKLSDEDSITIEFDNVYIPSRVNTIRIEQTLTLGWEKLGTRKECRIHPFTKQAHKFYPFSV